MWVIILRDDARAATITDFLIIGGGIAGASAAYALAEHGQVVLLERESSAGYHTTGRSAAQLLETYGSLSTRQLTRGGRAFLEDPPAGFTDRPLLEPRAALFFADEASLPTLDELYRSVCDLTPTVERLNGAEVRELVPVIREDHVASGMLEPDSMEIDVAALHQGFLRGARARGASVVLAAGVLALERRDGRWHATTRDGEHSARVVVNAAGAWCDEVAALVGAKPVGLTPKRRTVITFEAPPLQGLSGWPIAATATEDLYFKPESGGFLASPADETPSSPCDAQPEELDVALTVDRIERSTTLSVPRIASRWAGLRSFVADKSLVVGPDDQVEDFFWVAGQGGYGIQTSPAVGRTVASLLVDGRVPGDLATLGLAAEDLAPRRASLT